jgi:hypothetical protein
MVDTFALPFSDLISARNLKTPIFFLLALCILYRLPQNIALFGAVCFALIIWHMQEPVKVLYISTSILSMRYFFVNMGTMKGSDFTIFAPWRFRDIADTFFQYSGPFVFVFLLITIFNLLRNPSKRQRKLNVSATAGNLTLWGILIFIFISAVSALANHVSLFTTLFFIQIFLRPILFLALIVLADWTKEKLLNYFKFVFSIIFLMQIIPTFVENIPNILRGYVFFLDQFTGTFAYHFNPLTVQVLLYSFCILWMNYLQVSSVKSLLAVFLCFFSIISAQSGVQTVVNMISLIPFLIISNLSPMKFSLDPFRSKLKMGIAIGTLVVLVAIVILSPGLGGYDALVGYSTYSADRAISEGLLETPKFRTYEILFDSWKKGDINPIFGLGPGQYLTGGSGIDGNPSRGYILYNPMLFSAGLFSNMLMSPFNNFVGVTGEIGIFGYITLLLIVIIPLRHIWRNLESYHGTVWSPVAAGYIGIFSCMIGWSFFWNVFEDTVMGVFYYIIGGVLIVAGRLMENPPVCTSTEQYNRNCRPTLYGDVI